MSSSVINFAGDAGGIPNDDSQQAQRRNAELLNTTLQGLQQGSTLLVEGTFYMMGGVSADGLTDVTFVLNGEIIFSADTNNWPRGSDGRVLECITLWNPTNLVLTSDSVGGGVLDGRGWAWWHLPALGYLIRTEDRPRLLHVYDGANVLLENWLLLNPPYWATYFVSMNGLEIRHSGVLARRTGKEGHSLEDMTAFNTDGFDVSGQNVWIHDCNIWCQDDAIAVKDGSQNMLFERINASGVGLTIGSIGKSEVRNITFRDCYMYKTYKGIYMKFRNAQDEWSQRNSGIIENVLFENVVMDEPEHFPIWIGPAQQSDTRNPCYPNPCSICWPLFPGNECDGQRLGTYSNIALRNIVINRPQTSAGVIIADENNPMVNITFDNVRVNPCGQLAFDGMSSFPLLPDPFNTMAGSDRFVTSWRFFIVLVAALALSAIWNWRAALKKVWATNELVRISVVAFAVTVPTMFWYMKKKAPLSQADSYFVCSGVRDGVATGGTWPVPSCFDDRTLYNDQSERCYHNWVAPALFMSIAFSATFTYLLHSNLKSDSKAAPCCSKESVEEEDTGSYVDMELERVFEQHRVSSEGECA